MSEIPDRDGALEQLLHVLNRLPFVSGLKRDVMSLRGLLYERRPARLAALGPVGSGRTALGNALLGDEVLPPELPSPNGWLRLTSAGGRLDWLEVDVDAPLDAIHDALAEGQPDVVMVVVAPSDMDRDLAPRLRRAKLFREAMRQAGDGKVPIVVVLSKSDDVAVGSASGVGSSNREAVELARDRLESAAKAAGLEASAVLTTSFHGESRAASVARLTERLFAELPEVSRIETARAFPAADLQRREVANRIVRSTATIALTVGLAPVPLSDALLIAPLQVVMVSAIAHIGGRPWDRKAAIEWIASMGLVGGAGFGLRWTAQQLVKLVPGAGSLVSAGVAGAGTVTLGQSAIAYFLRDRSVPEIPADAAA